MRRAERGLTLVDIAISTAILVIIVGVAYPGFKIANDTISTSGVRDRLERSGDRILKSILTEARSGKITAITEDAPNPQMVVRQPQTGLDLADIDVEGGVPWSDVDRVTRYREMETIKESDARQDLNGDGDRDDVFSLGVIEITDEVLGFRPIVSRPVVMRASPSMLGDVNGDGVADPMFEMNAIERRLTAHVYLLGRDANGRYIRTEVQGSVRLRNAQN
jgi:hypothetical protein